MSGAKWILFDLIYFNMMRDTSKKERNYFCCPLILYLHPHFYCMPPLLFLSLGLPLIIISATNFPHFKSSHLFFFNIHWILHSHSLFFQYIMKICYLCIFFDRNDIAFTCLNQLCQRVITPGETENLPTSVSSSSANIASLRKFALPVRTRLCSLLIILIYVIYMMTYNALFWYIFMWLLCTYL